LFILLAIWYVTDSSLALTILAFLCIQLQGTLYNYYYVILRNRFDGDTTSRIFENETPAALKGEKQKYVNILFRLYRILYGSFDKAIYTLDRNASNGNWFGKSTSSRFLLSILYSYSCLQEVENTMRANLLPGLKKAAS
jgi:hypothetical protein